MNVIVQKYGGSSVKNIDTLKYVIQKIKEKIDKGYKLVVVVSAQGKTTDKLLKLSKEYGGEDNTKEQDLLLSTGEVISASLLTMLLKKEKINAVTYTATNLGIVTDSNFGNAKIEKIYVDKIVSELENGNVVVVAGFQGLDKLGNVTTLGRGGSDYTATSLAQKLNAKACEIYSDIDGVYTQDPNKYANAKLLDSISLNEMQILSKNGAKVLEEKSIEEFKNSSGELIVKNTKTNSKGTKIIKKDYLKIAKVDNLSKITLVGEEYFKNITNVKKVVDLINSMHIRIYLLQITEIAISLVVEEKNTDKLIEKIHAKFNE